MGIRLGGIRLHNSQMPLVATLGFVVQNEYLRSLILDSRAVRVYLSHVEDRLILGKRSREVLQRNVGEGYEFEAEVYMERDGAQYNLRMHHPASSDTESMHQFADSVYNDTPHMATGEEGVVVMQLLDAIYASAERGEPVKIA